MCEILPALNRRAIDSLPFLFYSGQQTENITLPCAGGPAGSSDLAVEIRVENANLRDAIDRQIVPPCRAPNGFRRRRSVSAVGFLPGVQCVTFLMFSPLSIIDLKCC